MLRQANRQFLHFLTYWKKISFVFSALLEKPISKRRDSEAVQKAKTLYASCMNESKWPDLRGTRMCYLCLKRQAFLLTAELCEALCRCTGFADLDSTECRGSATHFCGWLSRLRYTKAQEVSLRDLCLSGNHEGIFIGAKGCQNRAPGVWG